MDVLLLAAVLSSTFIQLTLGIPVQKLSTIPATTATTNTTTTTTSSSINTITTGNNDYQDSNNTNAWDSDKVATTLPDDSLVTADSSGLAGTPKTLPMLLQQTDTQVYNETALDTTAAATTAAAGLGGAVADVAATSGVLPGEQLAALGGGDDGVVEAAEEGDARCRAVCMANCTSHGGTWEACLLECSPISGCIDCESPCVDQSNTDASPPHSVLMAMELPRPGVVSFHWSSSNPDNLTGVVYVLQHKEHSSSLWRTITMTNATQYVSTSLDVCGNHSMRVAAANQHGASSYVCADEAKVAAVDAGSVNHTITQSQQELMIVLSWHPPTGWEQAMTSYTVSATFHENMQSFSINIHDHNLEVSSPTATIRVPIAEAEDSIFIKMNGKAGCLRTNTTMTTIKDIITDSTLKRVSRRISDVTVETFPTRNGSFSANVSWVLPSNNNSHVLQFDLYWGRGTAGMLDSYVFIEEDKSVVSLDLNTRSYRLTDLSPETEYGVEVVAHSLTTENTRNSFSLGRSPTHFATGVLPTTVATTLLTTTATTTTKKSVVLTLPYHPTQPAGLQSHRLSLYIVGPLALGLLTGFVACCGTCCYRKQRHGAKASLSRDEESIPNIYSSPSYPALLSTTQVKPDVLDRWEISPARIKVGEVLGEGAFGQVLKGLVVGRIWSHQSSLSAIVPREATHGEHTVVAVKMLHKFAEDSQKQEFLREIELMKELGYHPNVVSLLGCCTIQDPICLLVEHCYYGDMLHYLRNRRPQLFDQFKTGRAPRTPCKDSLRPIDLLSFARQIAMGMEYISQKGFVHRDLAARNVMVADDKNVKIGDFGLTRYVYDDKVYVNRRGGKLPVKWMSLEAIYDQIFTTKGDVWSYGVVLFEIMTLGAAPYPGIPNKDMPKLLKGGYRMEKPDNCSLEIFAMLESCWCDDPERRPGFTELRSQLEVMMEEDVCYMEFDSEKQQCFYYSSSSSEEDSSDELELEAEASPMLESATNQDAALLATPMLKIPSLQTRSTQNLSHAYLCSEPQPCSMSLNSLNRARQHSPLPWLPPVEGGTFGGHSVDNRAYYAGHIGAATDSATSHRLACTQGPHETNPYSGVVASMEDIPCKDRSMLAELNLELNPHAAAAIPQCTAESRSHKQPVNCDTSSSDGDSCLCDEKSSDDDRLHALMDLSRSSTFDSADLSPDDAQTVNLPSSIALKRFSDGKDLVSPTSLDSGVSCDLATTRLILDACKETSLCSNEDLTVYS